ncbi:hypothetical protein DL766_009438 [Monosporascus sp. MC13-8B]|uniref:Riboflavin kinase n=1 Tax=Monosporascus cannonballus TaxID=155416 RepID=A0ABY0HAD4_9PEZI|nr:hypothetical protein DL762_005118 [Monosporascus cannonballus]RYP00476.1 hypothetical protein DL763_000828 [Monosporascus cannonballus]RYP15303.1 hypothetical protein DL766_009438 [Monosporascus sp. MC13-8B]
MEPPKVHGIDRKPMPSGDNKQRPPSPGNYDILDDFIDGYLDEPPPYSPPRDDHRHVKEGPPKDTWPVKQQTQDLTLNIHIPPPPPPPTLPPRHHYVPLVSRPSDIPVNPASSAPEASSTAARSLWQTAVDETIHFAGGLISRPFESTKHYSILRHSLGVICYKGASTSVTITVFSDMPLPPDRTLWLQRRGFSGDLGMNVGARFGTRSNWIDVTPSCEALASDVPASDERAWQRDIKKFLKKASSRRNLAKQAVRETCVVRIPASVDDGYVRILMCSGEGSKKLLCPSPVFRVASTSSDVSVLRGASMATMPLEIGLKVASAVGEAYVNRFIGPVTAVVGKGTAAVQSKVEKHQPGFITKKAATFASVKSGLQDSFTSLEERYAPMRANTYDALHESKDFESLPTMVGSEDGPEKPFPISFKGRVVRGTGQSKVDTGTPTANLSDVPADLMLRLGGIYIGWATVRPRDGLVGVSYDWHEAVITIAPSPHAAGIVAKNVADVRIIHDFGEHTFFDATLEVVLMAFLRPAPKPDRSRQQPREDAIAAVSRDVDVAVLSLSRQNWQPEETTRRLRTMRSQRGLVDWALEVRDHVQKEIDNVPMHRLGIRTTGAQLKDKALGNGGMYIRR